jgi:undecaprenyl-diphosphatase
MHQRPASEWPVLSTPTLAIRPSGTARQRRYPETIDFRAYHDLNVFVLRHEWLADLFGVIEVAAPVVLASATVVLWLLARPGSDRKWKLASTAALTSAGLALLVNQLIADLWDRARPFQSHADAHTFVPRSHDASFPSDHASAAFGIAFAVLCFDRLAGALFVSAAALIAVGRVVVGVHYPGDVLAGALVGLACAVLVCKLALPLLRSLVRLVERVTDPVVAPVWRRLPPH